METPRRRWPFIILGIGLGMVLMAVIAVVGLGVYGWGLFNEQVIAAMNQNAVIVEHLGQVRDAELDLAATSDVPGEDFFVYKAVGTKGTGIVTGEFVTVDADHEEIASGTLELPDGRKFDLVPGSPAGDGG